MSEELHNDKDDQSVEGLLDEAFLSMQGAESLFTARAELLSVERELLMKLDAFRPIGPSHSMLMDIWSKLEIVQERKILLDKLYQKHIFGIAENA
jgi:hypothetical protein